MLWVSCDCTTIYFVISLLGQLLKDLRPTCASYNPSTCKHNLYLFNACSDNIKTNNTCCVTARDYLDLCIPGSSFLCPLFIIMFLLNYCLSILEYDLLTPPYLLCNPGNGFPIPLFLVLFLFLFSCIVSILERNLTTLTHLLCAPGGMQNPKLVKKLKLLFDFVKESYTPSASHELCAPGWMNTYLLSFTLAILMYLLVFAMQTLVKYCTNKHYAFTQTVIQKTYFRLILFSLVDVPTSNPFLHKIYNKNEYSIRKTFGKHSSMAPRILI